MSPAGVSPLVLGAVAMPWILERVIVGGVSLLAPAYRSVVTGGVLGVVLYPVITGAIVLVGLYALLDPRARRVIFPTNLPTRRELLAIPIAGVGAAAIGFVVTGAAAVVLGGGGNTPGLNGSIDASFVFWFLVTGAVFAPLVEEILFRGLLLAYLLEHVPTSVAGGMVAVSFGLVHAHAGPARMIGAAAIGGLLVVVRLRYGSLFVPIGVHALNNVLVLVILIVLVGG